MRISSRSEISPKNITPERTTRRTTLRAQRLNERNQKKVEQSLFQSMQQHFLGAMNNAAQEMEDVQEPIVELHDDVVDNDLHEIDNPRDPIVELHHDVVDNDLHKIDNPRDPIVEFPQARWTLGGVARVVTAGVVLGAAAVFGLLARSGYFQQKEADGNPDDLLNALNKM